MNRAWTKFLPPFLHEKLDGRMVLQKVIANTGWLFIDQIFRLAVGLFVTVWVARYLGPEGFGILNYALAFVVLFSTFATVGLNSIVVRNIVNEPASTNETLGTTFVLKLFGGLGSLILAYTVISIMRPADATTRWMVAIIATGLVFQAFDAIDFWFQSQIKSKYTVYAKNAAFLFASLGKIGLIIIKAPIIAFAWIGLLEVIVGSIGLIIVYRINGHSLWQWHINFSQAKKLLNDSWPLIFAGLAVIAYMRIDQIMLGEMIGADAVGIYSVAIMLSGAWHFIPVAIITSVYPAIIEAKKIDQALYYKRLQNLYDLMALLSISISIPVTIFAGNIIALLYGESFADAEAVLSLTIWSGLFVSWGMASSQFLLTENLSTITLYKSLAGAVVNIAFNLVLIPAYGIIGAAIATLISYFVAAFFVVFFAKTRQQSVMMLKSLLPISAFKKGFYV